MRVVKLKLGLLGIMAGAVISTGLMGWTNISPVDAAAFQIDAVKTEYLDQPIVVNGGEQRVMLMLRDIDLRDLLKSLASRAGFNILLDESVDGTISVDLLDITINQALESIKDYANLTYMQDDKTLIVASKDSKLSKNINQQVSQMIPVKYVNAKLVADILNGTVFASGSAGEGGDNASKKATAEYRTNSVVVVGTDNDLRLAEDMVKRLDIPRESKTFKINHASVIEVTQLLQATVFNDGVAPFNASGSGTGGLASSPVSVLVESFEEGSGTEEVQGASGEGGGAQAQTFTLRTKTIAEKEIKISPEGPMLVPDTRSNTLTIMGTVEQIALAEAVIPTLDQKLPQVALEASLVEISENAAREMSGTWGQQSGQWRTGFNDALINPVTAGVPNADPTQTNGGIIGIPSLNDRGRTGGSVGFSTKPLDNSLQFVYQLNMLLSKQKAKLLANPTVIAIHNTEAVISITEEIIRRTTVTRDATGFTQVQSEIGEAGIILNILPKITGDGFVNLRIRPSISTIADVIIRGEDVTTLLRRKDFAVQESRVANGQTLALGGLIEETATRDHSKIPGLGDLPIVGALFRTNNRGKERTELIMLVTPNILEDSKPIVSSGFSQEPLSRIAEEDQMNKVVKNSVPVPSSYDVIPEPVEVRPIVEQKEVKVIDVPDADYEIKKIQPETRVNAYTIDSVMQEFGINNLDVKPKKDYDKSQIDKLLNEYLPQGSK